MVEVLGLVNGDVYVNVGVMMGNYGVKILIVGGYVGFDDDILVLVIKDNFGKIIEFVIIKSGVEGVDFGVDGDFKI